METQLKQMADNVGSGTLGLNAGCGATRPQKHIDLDNAVNDINSLITHAKDLLSQMTGENMQGEPIADAKVSNAPTLIQVINNSPERIRNRCNEVHELLDQIKSELF